MLSFADRTNACIQKTSGIFFAIHVLDPLQRHRLIFEAARCARDHPTLWDAGGGGRHCASSLRHQHRSAYGHSGFGAGGRSLRHGPVRWTARPERECGMARVPRRVGRCSALDIGGAHPGVVGHGCQPVLRRGRRLRTEALSSTEAELVSAMEAIT